MSISKGWKWMVCVGLITLIACERNMTPLETEGETTAVTGGCDPSRPIGTAEETDNDRGFFNPKDSLLYATVVFGIYYRGGQTNPCELVRRPESFKNLISRKFRVVWQGPRGATTDQQIPRALIRFTDKNFQDDVDRNLPRPDSLRPFPHEIKVKEDSTYVIIPTNREYKVALRKGYSNLLNEVKCAEVSLSTSPAFDERMVILENSTTRSWSDRYFMTASSIAPERQFIVVREKECATCEVPIPTLSTTTPVIGRGQEAVLAFQGCPVNENGQGPLEWFEQPVGGQKRLVQRFSYSASNERRFTPQTTTTYFLRCQGDWHCKPQREVSITIEVR
ncbi:MAG: hypothetical protein ACK4GN_04995 [Runella sp.]